jgi:hypothetical protein
MVCCFDLKKSRNDWRISLLVIIGPLGPGPNKVGQGLG